MLSQHAGPVLLPDQCRANSDTTALETAVGVTITPKVSVYGNAAWYHSRFGEFVIESEDGDEVLTGNGLPIAPRTS